MPLEIIKGNIFNSQCQTLVNTVNCQGVMGKGIALEFSYRFPEMEEKYKKLCEKNKISIGRLWIYKTEKTWVLNFPTKNDWKQPSKLEYIEKGLQNFSANYRREGIESIAFPQLGASSGGLSWDEVRVLMEKYLSPLEIPIEIYVYDSNAEDSLYNKFLDMIRNSSVEDLKNKIRIKEKEAVLLQDVLKLKTIKNFAILRNVKGLGKRTIERIYAFVSGNEKEFSVNTERQYTWFNNI